MAGWGAMSGPHQDQPLVTAGAPLAEADAAIVFVHGRGATARSIVQLGQEFDAPGIAFLAPQAAGNTWYPNSFLSQVELNEPGRSSGLEAIGAAIDRANEAQIVTGRVMLVGFSQGACLATEYAARHPRRYGGVAGLSGGLIGAEIDREEYSGDLERTPVFLGCSDTDPHIPEERVHETAAVFETLNAEVTTRIYEGMGHGVNADEIEHLSGMVEEMSE